MVYEYRVFIDRGNAETDAMHYSDEKLYEGAIFLVNKPGGDIHRTPVLVWKVDNHPTDDTPGIAHAHVEGVR
jgi:hypothetical protein